MDQKERMLAELPYLASDEVLSRERLECKRKIYELNNVHPDQYDRIPGLLKELFGKTGEAVFVEPPFHCDYGYNIEVGEDFFANYNCTVLDVAKVTIGKNAFFVHFSRRSTGGTGIADRPALLDGYEHFPDHIICSAYLSQRPAGDGRYCHTHGIRNGGVWHEGICCHISAAVYRAGRNFLCRDSGMVGGLCAAGNCVLQKDCIFQNIKCA